MERRKREKGGREEGDLSHFDARGGNKKSWKRKVWDRKPKKVGVVRKRMKLLLAGPWAAQCGGGLPYPCEEEEEMERPRLLSNLFSTRVTSPRRETTSTTTSWREPHRSVMRDQTRVFRTRFPLLSQSRHNHTFPTLESDDGAGLATKNF